MSYHPHDLTLLEIGLKTIYPPGSKLTSTAILRVKPRGQNHYSLFYCSKVVTETFENGMMKKILVGASEITDNNHALVSALKEISRLNNERILSNFTNRGKEVFHLIVKGLKNKEIAAALFISFKTVKIHRSHLIRKANVKNSQQLAAFAIESGEY